MLLAAGRGERMRPLTDHTPKPLLEAGGKALIVWHIENLVNAGIRELVINHAHLGAQIEKALGDGSQLGAHIQYSPEAHALETAGGIANALPLLGNEPFAVINGDIFCDYDFARLAKHAEALSQKGDAAHLVLVNNPAQHPSGDFYLNGNRIASTPPNLPNPPQPSLVREGAGEAHDPPLMKPLAIRLDYQKTIAKSLVMTRGARGVEALTFSGIGIYQPSLFSHIPRGSIAPLAPLLRAQIALGKVSGEHHRGLWADAGTPQRLAELDRQIRSQHNAP